MSSHPILVFGGALIGNTYNTQDEVSALLDKLKSTGIGRIDTAARYPPTNRGASERLLGEAGAAKLGFLIDTKVMASGDGSGSLEPAAIEHSVRISRERLKLQQNRINVLFTHMPDPKTPLERQAAGLDAEYRRGFIKQVKTKSPLLFLDSRC
jgi:aflatoxin B1 aldehyde reductase